MLIEYLGDHSGRYDATARRHLPVTLAYGHDRRLMGQLLSTNGQWTESTLYLGDGLMEKVTTYPNNIAQEDNWHYIYAQGRLVAMALRYSSASASDGDFGAGFAVFAIRA